MDGNQKGAARIPFINFLVRMGSEIIFGVNGGNWTQYDFLELLLFTIIHLQDFQIIIGI